jgi:putative membrane protein
MWLDLTEQLPLYINPKFTILIEISYCSLIPMLIICLLDTFLHTNKPHEHSKLGQLRYIPFFAVLLLAATLPNNTLNANLVNNKGLNSTLTLNTTSATIQDIPRPLAKQFHQADSIKVTDLNYTEATSEINDFSGDYLGKEISMTGFVFRSPGLTNSQLSLVRYVITCCVADSLPYGVMCEIKDAKNYPDGTWLSIEGTVQMGHYENKDTPFIKVTSAKQIEAPKKPYVFPYD